MWTKIRLRDWGYDLAPEGKRLAACVAGDANEEKPPTHLTFLLNFFDELRRKAPTGKVLQLRAALRICNKVLFWGGLTE